MRRLVVSTAVALSFSVPACSDQNTKSPERGLPPPPIQATETSEISQPSEVSVSEANVLTRSGEVTLIDVRRPSEWKETGVAEGAVGITLQDADFLDQVLAATNGDKSRPIALICRSGNRSSQAQEQLQAAGFTTVYNVAGGTLDWKAKGLPTEYCRSC